MTIEQTIEINREDLIPKDHHHYDLLKTYSILGIRLILYCENIGSLNTTSSLILSLKHEEAIDLKNANIEFKDYLNILFHEQVFPPIDHPHYELLKSLSEDALHQIKHNEFNIKYPGVLKLTSSDISSKHLRTEKTLKELEKYYLLVQI